MPLPTQATLIYTCPAAPGASLLAQKTVVENAPIDQDVLDLIGVSISSDTTNTVGTNIVRTIVLDLLPAFFERFPDTNSWLGPFFNLFTNVISRYARLDCIASDPTVA